jgi:microcystin-dependent protein
MPGTTPNLNLPYPIPGDTVDVPRDIKALADALDPVGAIPIGSMTMWPTAVAPNGWLLCKGQTNIPAATYPALATVLGTTGGMINMPDFTDRFPIGQGASAIMAAGGDNAPKLTGRQSGVRAHNHGGAVVAVGTHNHGNATGLSNQNLDHDHDAGVLRPGWPFGAAASWPMSLGSGYAVPASNTVGPTFSPNSGGIAGGPSALTSHTHGISSDGAHAHTINNEAEAVALDALDNRPAFRAVNFIIRAL